MFINPLIGKIQYSCIKENLKPGICVFMLFTFSTSCTNTIPTSGYPSTGVPGGPPPSDAYYDGRIRGDEDRNAVLGDSRARFRGNLCEDESRNHRCKDQCRTMYRRTNDKEDCEELAVEQIVRLMDVHDILKRADDEELRNIDLEDLEVYLNVSIAGFDDLIRDYRSSEAKDVLVWIANNDEIADILRDEDEQYKTLEQLLKTLGSFSSSELEDPFTRNINRGTLFEVAIDARNESAVNWFMEYIFNVSNSCNNDDEVSIGCFTVICKIGDEFEDEDFLRDWFGFSNFENYIEDIIEGKINAGGDPKWDASAITEVDDLFETSPYEDQTWVESLCGGLA